MDKKNIDIIIRLVDKSCDGFLKEGIYGRR